MITAPPRPVAPLAVTHLSAAPRAPRPSGRFPLSPRPAGARDADALAGLSAPFVRSGALRERPLHVYAARAADFLVVDAPDGSLDACLALRTHGEGAGESGRSGVLYNFCVAPHRQGSGLGARLLEAALARSRAQSLTALFTATTGSGRLFLRYGFEPTRPSLAPASWARNLDPRRGARVLARAV
ncbi:GNAT family N-acetyltransferase [Streptomyces sp. KLOTTS4A1]|uniref:GNAT family N-acetyltransferase n=1 Tax=Streptomyces sp. KLOTTS4A1 TaxID=3390996 RepID=UPI0039F60456